MGDPTADFILSDLLMATEYLIDFSINALDAIRLQNHYNERNRRIQLNESAENEKNLCSIVTSLKYDLSLNLHRILRACKRTKTNLLLLRAARTHSTNHSLLLVASTRVRVEKVYRRVQVLTRLVKENGGEFPKKSKKADVAKVKKDFLSKDDLNDYVEIVLSFRMLIRKYREFVDELQQSMKSKSTSSDGITLIPIASNSIDQLNKILNRLMRMSFTVE